MRVSQIKPVTQLGLSSQFDNIKFWNVKTAFRTKFPFLLPSVMMPLKSCRPYSDLSRPGVFNCYFLPAVSTFTWEWRTHSRPLHIKDLFNRQRENKNKNKKQPTQHKITKLCSAGLFNPHILTCAQPGSKKLLRPTSHLLLQLSSLMSWYRHMNNHTPAIRFVKSSCANKGESSGDEQLRSLTFSQDWLLLWSDSAVEGKV